jgi:D-ribose pyranase
MLRTGILNPAINSLISRVEEFLAANGNDVRLEFEQALSGVPLIFEPHVQFKKRVPQAVGLIRTGDTIPYANLIVESG